MDRPNSLKRTLRSSFDEPAGKASRRWEQHSSDRVTINDLPDELIDQVFGHLSSYRHFLNYGWHAYRINTRALWSLCLASTRSRRIAEPYLYSVFRNDGAPRTRRQFIKRIIERPDLAVLVTHLYLSDWRNAYGTQDDDLGEFGILLAAAENVDIDGKEDFSTALSNRNSDAETALLLASTPNLKTLDLEIPFDLEESWLMGFLRRAVSVASRHGGLVANPQSRQDPVPARALSSLRHLSARHWDTENGFDPIFFRMFLGLPSLRTISGFMADEGTSGTGNVWPRKKSNIEEISFEYSDLSNHDVSGMLNACKALKSFTYRWGPATVGATDFDIQELLRALESQSDSLENLVLDSRESLYLNELEDDLILPIGSFKTFNKLKHLEISGLLLVGEELIHENGYSHDEDLTEARPKYEELSDVFPASLEVLQINHFGETMDYFLPYLESLASNCSERLPRLRKLDISAWTNDVPTELIEWSNFIARLSSLLPYPGVELYYSP